ncbi:hypothetical protein KC19_5G058200 [Ceratodon purpureus]|nr:hypothetical protein KC19_5G058200 [Ceratodon purpureus]
MKSASTPRWVRTKLAAMSQGQASPAETRTLDNDEVSSGDHALQELVTIKSMEMQTRASCVDQCDDSLTGTSYSVKRSRRRRAVVVSDGDIRDLCLNGQPRNAIHILEQRGIDPSAYAYVCLLRRCTNLRDIVEGKYVHAHMTKSGFVSSTFVLNALLNMYMKCGSLVDAREVFDNMRERDMFTWTMMLTGYSKLGYHEQAYEIYEQMHKERVPLDKITFTTILSVCASLGSLEKGKKVHSDMIKAGIRPDRILGNTLIDMYAKCGNIRQGHKVFKEMSERDIVTWNVMIAGAAQNGYFDEAFEFFEAMREAGLKPDKVTYVSVLNACSSLEQGRILHLDIVEAGFELDLRVGTALVNMFSKCGSLKDALHTFDKLPQRNVFSWTSVIAACAQVGKTEKALEFYEKMLEEGIVADKLTYTTILRVCATLGDLKKGREVHDRIVKSGITSDLIMESTLIDMYAKCGRVEDAHQLLENMNERDVVSFTAVVSGYVQQGQFREALIVFHKMQREGVLPNTAAFLSVLKACAGLRSYAEGRRIHASIVEAGLTGESNLEHALADMYAKCDSCSDAHEVSSTFA